MERVTLLHMARRSGGTFTSLCQPLVVPDPPTGMVGTPGTGARGNTASGGGAHPAGTGAKRGQCVQGGAAVGDEPGYHTLSNAALWDCAATPRVASSRRVASRVRGGSWKTQLAARYTSSGSATPPHCPRCAAGSDAPTGVAAARRHARRGDRKSRRYLGAVLGAETRGGPRSGADLAGRLRGRAPPIRPLD